MKFYVFTRNHSINGRVFMSGQRVQMEQASALWYLDQGILREVPSYGQVPKPIRCCGQGF